MTTCVVQARMGSTRLPGKVLADLGGRPLLAFMLRRLASLPVEHLVVATSDRALDDPVAQVAAAEGALVVRGPEADVLRRMRMSLDAHPSDRLVRLTADCPFVDPAVVSAAVRRQRDTGADYVSNTLVRTFPDGLDVEVIDASALRAADDEAVDPVEREHVTPFVYRRPERFRLASLVSGLDAGKERWTVDTAGDLVWVREVVARLASPSAAWEQIFAVAGRRSTPSATGLVPDPLAHPASRRWTVLRPGGREASVRVDVTTGVGVASLFPAGALDGCEAAAVLRHLRTALAADAQVRELRLDPPAWHQ